MTTPHDLTLLQKMRSWTPAYLVRRVRQMVYFRTHPAAPWITPQAIHILSEWLQPTDRGFEWGSGRSTTWYARRTQHITSIEHNARWHQKVSQTVRQQTFNNIILHHVEADERQGANADYVTTIEDVSDPLDYIIVDGILRDHCALAALDKLKRGGILLVDDAHRYLPHPNWIQVPYVAAGTTAINDTWQEFADRTQSWRTIWTNDGVDTTLLLYKV